MKIPHLPATLLAPRHWSTWFAMGLLRLLGMLPYRTILRVGAWLGRRAMPLLGRRRRVAEINLGLCFPERSAAEREALLVRHFEALGIALFEFSLSWWGGAKRLRGLGHYHGLEHFQRAREQGKGVILLSAHFLPLDIGGRLLLEQTEFCAMYRRHKNPVVEWIMARNRERHITRAIPSKAIKEAIRILRKDQVLWYAPDQNTTPSEAVFANFFGIPASTNSGTARLVRITGAAVVPFRAVRRRDGCGYDLIFEPMLEGYPSGDLVADTQRVNDIIEGWARRDPEQYLWVHRRFRHRPEPDAPPIYP